MSRSHDREILRLAVPAFLALAAEPLFLLADAAIVGHLGTAPLAGLGIAAAVLQTAVGLCVFLAYGTTASVARHLGAGDTRGALTQGIDGVWLAVADRRPSPPCSASPSPTPLVELVRRRRRGRGAGGRPTCGSPSSAPPRCWSCSPPPACCAACRTPGPRWSSPSSATPLTSRSTCCWSTAPASGSPGPPGARSSRRSLSAARPHRGRGAGRPARGRRAAARPGAASGPRPHAGVPLVIRTLTLRAALLVTTYAVTLGALTDADQAADLATHQLALTLWTFLAFVLDAVAIAAQAITGRYLGAGDVAGTRAVTDRMVRWGLWSGVVTGVAARAREPAARPALHRRPGGPRPAGRRCCSWPPSGSRSPASCSCSTAS